MMLGKLGKMSVLLFANQNYGTHRVMLCVDHDSKVFNLRGLTLPHAMTKPITVRSLKWQEDSVKIVL